VTFGGIFIVLLPRILQLTFLDYLSNTAGMILIGFAIVYLLPKFERYFEWINYYTEDQLLAEKELKKFDDKEINFNSENF